MAGDGVMEFGNWIVEDALQEKPCVKVPEFPDELTCLKLDESDVSVEWRVYVPKGSECPECKERQGYYLDAETIQRQQERIAELERILDLDKLEIIRLTDEVNKRDELIRDMWEYLTGGTEYCLSCALRDGCDLDVYGDDCGMRGVFERRLRELGIGEKS